MERVWRMRPAPPAGFARTLGMPSLHAHLLFNRGVLHACRVEPFLAADTRLATDPMSLPGMGAAVERLGRAVHAREGVGVIGDFDVDGLTATALLVQALRELGIRTVAHIPDRVEEGHGPSERAVRRLHAAGVSLIVTVDCGISSAQEVALARSLGVDTVITDHHAPPPGLPDASAIVSPRPPPEADDQSAPTGVGIAFKLVEALWAELGRARPEHLLELVALGTVADVGRVTGESRYMVRRGLEVLAQTASPGLRALMDRAGLDAGALDTDALAFGLIPRLNAAGRLGSADVSLRLLTTTDAAEARRLADELERSNRQRQDLTERGVQEAMGRLLPPGADPASVPSIAIVADPGWSPGIVGLIAGKLSEWWYRPAVAIALGDEASRGSARSIEEFDIVAALREMQDLFIRYGGHPRAAGFTMRTADVPELMRRLTALADERLTGKSLTPALILDCEMESLPLASPLMDFVRRLAPFGEGNPEPLFLTRGVRVADARQVGTSGQHLRMRLAQGGMLWDAICFRQGSRLREARDRVDLVYAVGTNTWSGEATPQARVEDFQPSRPG